MIVAARDGHPLALSARALIIYHGHVHFLPTRSRVLAASHITNNVGIRFGNSSPSYESTFCQGHLVQSAQLNNPWGITAFHAHNLQV